MIERIRTIWVDWQSQLNIAQVSEWFIKANYLVLLWSTLKLMLIGDVVWGTQPMSMMFNPYAGVDRFAMLLNVMEIRAFWWIVASSFVVLLVVGLFGVHYFVTRVLVAYLFVLLHYGNVEISTGGHHLMQQMLFFHVLFFKVSDDSDALFSSFKRLLHHFGFYAVWVNIAVLYLVAGVMKFKGDLWLNGEALLMTLSFKEFGFPWLSDMFTQNNGWLWVSNHIVFGYQLLFPVLIWIKSIRKYLLSLGLIFHLSIAFLIGITDFGLIMVSSYVIFIDPDSIKNLGSSDLMNIAKRKGK